MKGRIKKEPNTEKLKISERTVGKFMRTIRFPGLIVGENIKTQLCDGILCISAPKAPSGGESFSIEIQ